MSKRRLTPARALVVLALLSIVPALIVWLGVDSVGTREERAARFAPYLVPQPTVDRLSLPRPRVSGDLTLFDLPVELAAASINDVVIDDESVWLGTANGLARLVPQQSLTRYRQFGAAPFEWASHLALDGTRLAVSISVADGNIGGADAGAFLFDTATADWTRIGNDVLDQVWLADAVWQRARKGRLTRIASRDGRWITTEIPLDSRLCSEAYMSVVGAEIWIAQQGTFRASGARRRGGVSARAIPCGVLRYDPATGKETLYEEDTGLNNGFGRDVAGDARAVYVSHSIKHDKLSVFDPATDSWRPARPNGTGNRIALSARAVWLASPGGRTPFVRIDRQTEQRRNIAGIPEGFYVSALVVDGDVVWLGLHRKTYTDTAYTVEALLGRYVDR